MLVIHGEPSFCLATPELELYLTQRGGHLAPVIFHLPAGDVSPYALAPWEPAEFPEIPPLLSVLRGDFFCLPFTGQAVGPPHGETANSQWTQEESDARSLHLKIQTTDTGATVEKLITTRARQHAIYVEHRISNLEGDFSFGTHPILDFSKVPEGAGRITTSAFHWASTFPGAFANPADGETQALAEGAVFTDLSVVALANGGTTDLTRYPARAGHDDLVMMANSPATPAQPFAWSAAVFEDYVWICLKDPADFPATLLWTSNGGREAEPWGGKHLGRAGIEDVCSHFCDGVDVSRQDLLAGQGIPTTRHFGKDEIVSLKTISAVATVPKGFGAMRQIVPAGKNGVILTGDSGTVQINLDWQFLAK